MIIKKKNIRTIVITCALLGIIIFSIHSYNVYMSRQIYNEGTSNVKASYSQVNQTFNMFAQRNWNVLSDWNVYLTKILNNDSGLQWNDFVREKEKWYIPSSPYLVWYRMYRPVRIARELVRLLRKNVRIAAEQDFLRERDCQNYAASHWQMPVRCHFQSL